MPILIAMFISLVCLTVLEFYSVAWLWHKTNGLVTLIIVLGTGIIGAFIARKNAKEALRRLLKGQNFSKSGPAKQVFDAIAFFLAAALLIIPGIITDFLGLLLLLPLTRSLLFKKFIKGSAVDTKVSSSFKTGKNANHYKKHLDDSDSVIDVQAEEVND